MDEIDVLKDEFEVAYDIAKQYPDAICTEKFTFDVFLEAHTLVCTRCFGYSLPYLMIVPFADCANHHATDNQYELFNSRIEQLTPETVQREEERFYFTNEKKRINFTKHFTEDGFEDKVELPYKSARYAKKVQLRNNAAKITLEDFLNNQVEDIWDLKYISTSDDEDNDSDMASSDDSEEEPELSPNCDILKDANDKPVIALDGGPNLPALFKNFKKTVGSKKQSRVQYEYKYSNDPETK